MTTPETPTGQWLIDTDPTTFKGEKGKARLEEAVRDIEREAAGEDRDEQIGQIAVALYEAGYGTRGNLNHPERVSIATSLYDAGLRATPRPR